MADGKTKGARREGLFSTRATCCRRRSTCGRVRRWRCLGIVTALQRIHLGPILRRHIWRRGLEVAVVDLNPENADVSAGRVMICGARIRGGRRGGEERKKI
jgi:hypothetical protein